MPEPPANVVPPADPAAVPDSRSVFHHLLYGLSLPERALRGTTGLLGGAVHQSAALLVPQAFRDSKTYTILVNQMLDFMIHDIARVKANSEEPPPAAVDNFVARKTVGNFVEMAGMATLHVSPLTVLAILSDVAYGSQSMLKELSAELKRHGIIDEESTIDHAGDLLSAIGQTSGATASAFDTPPLSLEGMRDTIEQTRAAVTQIDVARVIPKSEVDRMWLEMQDLAQREGVDVLELSSAVTLHALDKVCHVGRGALSTVRVAGTLLDRHIIDHYENSIGEVRNKGFYRTLAESSEPYIDALWTNFSSQQSTITEDLLSGKLLGQASKTVLKWFGVDAEEPQAPASPNKTPEPPQPPSGESGDSSKSPPSPPSPPDGGN